MWMSRVQYILKLLNIKHWIKNILVFFPIFFSANFTSHSSLIRVAYTFCAFCLLASAAHLFNDICDKKMDSIHLFKRTRPIASGQVTVMFAAKVIAVLLCMALIVGFYVSIKLVLCILAYSLINLIYSVWFKKSLLLSTLTVPFFYIVRAYSGAVVINVEFSYWLFILVYVLSLFITLNKRYADMKALDNLAIKQSRYIRYSVVLSSVMVVLFYMFYSVSERTVLNYGSAAMIYTTPLVCLGVIRYAYLNLYTDGYYMPVVVLFKDRLIQALLLMWVVLCYVIIY